VAAAKRRPDTLPAIRPSAAIEAQMQQRLQELVEEMHRSILWWIAAAYRAKPPAMAGDELRYQGSPSTVMQRVMARLTRKWQKRFDTAAPMLAKYFTTDIAKRNDRAMLEGLRKAGMTVKFQMTAQMNDVLRATMAEQVGLIKSIAQQHLTEVQGLVMRSVAKGGDLGELSQHLRDRYGVTRRRAALISRDQVTKATATLNRTRQLELGIETAIWKHSHAGKTPRPSHVAMEGKEYDVKKGMWDPDANGKGKGAFIQPGELISCRCYARSILPWAVKRAA
jgi:uncharacterized protein with gpF-like domain